MKIISAKTFGKKQYKEIGFEGIWRDSFGSPEWNARWLVYGDRKNGKTEMCCQLAKYMSGFGKVYYISNEQGDSSSLKDAFIRNGLTTCGNVRLVYHANFEDIKSIIQHRGKKYTIIIDSIDYTKMNADEYRMLNKLAKNIMLVFVSWAKGAHPKTQAAKDVAYMVDIVAHVSRFAVQNSEGRYGGTSPYVIYEEKANRFHSFLNRQENDGE